MERTKRTRKRNEAAAAPTRPSGRHPARIYRELQVNGSRLWALFDSGARNTYVTRAAARRLSPGRLPKPVTRALGGRVFKITESCALLATLEGYGIATLGLVVDRLFPDERGRPIDVLLGMEAMETWGIGLDTRHKRLDFTHYAKDSVEGMEGNS